jgi:hypothetical protein
MAWPHWGRRGPRLRRSRTARRQSRPARIGPSAGRVSRRRHARPGQIRPFGAIASRRARDPRRPDAARGGSPGPRVVCAASRPNSTRDKRAHLVMLYRAGEHTVFELEDLFGITRSTLYRAVPHDTRRQPAGPEHARDDPRAPIEPIRQRDARGASAVMREGSRGRGRSRAGPV